LEVKYKSRAAELYRQNLTIACTNAEEQNLTLDVDDDFVGFDDTNTNNNNNNNNNNNTNSKNEDVESLQEQNTTIRDTKQTVPSIQTTTTTTTEEKSAIGNKNETTANSSLQKSKPHTNEKVVLVGSTELLKLQKESPDFARYFNLIFH
jgi:hypothetical protein